METYARVVADSIAPSGARLTTMELCYQRFIHSEFNTHRAFSRNAASSRAIPVQKMLDQVREHPAIPIHWGKNQPGMQAREELDHLNGMSLWLDSAEYVAENCRIMSEFGYHKQVVNRLLEPFQYIKVIVTATEWDNFFKLRLHEDAQPEMMVLAEHIKAAMDSSVPVELNFGQWHLPYVNLEDFKHWFREIDQDGEQVFGYDMYSAKKCSAARCARVSYLNHDNSTPDINKDIALADKLLEAGHMSPFEHQLSPMESPKDNYNFEKGVTHIDRYGWKWSGNVRGFYQYRQLI